jgi:hypothetical protein
MSHRARSQTRRGSAILKVIHITGFHFPLLIEHGRAIKDWSARIKLLLQAEGPRLAAQAQRSPPVDGVSPVAVPVPVQGPEMQRETGSPRGSEADDDGFLNDLSFWPDSQTEMDMEPLFDDQF